MTPIILPAVTNALIGIAVYFWPLAFKEHFVWVFGICAYLTFVVIYGFKSNFLFQARLLLLATIGYYAGFVKSIDPTIAFSPVEIGAQTFEVGARMFGLTSLALLGAVLGLLSARITFNTHTSLMSDQKHLSQSSALIVFWLASAIVIVVGYFSAKSYGPTVFGAAYASGEGEGQALGNLQSIGIVSLLVCGVASLTLQSRRLMLLSLVWALYLLGWGILIRGGRLEVLSGIFALFIGIQAAQGKVAHLKIYHYIIIILLAGFMEVWGALRDTLFDGSAGAELVISSYQKLADSGVYHAGTISGIATTFSNILHMFENNLVTFRFGSTYFDYLARTPPEFIYPNRPPDLAWMFDQYGYRAIGGFFELSEAYLNFGILGCLIIPFIISYLIAACYKRALLGSFLYFMLLAALLAVFFRGAWYQSFSFYKSIFTGLVLYFAFAPAITWKRRKHKALN